jgi:hypothetical protein
MHVPGTRKLYLQIFTVDEAIYIDVRAPEDVK